MHSIYTVCVFSLCKAPEYSIRSFSHLSVCLHCWNSCFIHVWRSIMHCSAASARVQSDHSSIYTVAARSVCYVPWGDNPGPFISLLHAMMPERFCNWSQGWLIHDQLLSTCCPPGSLWLMELSILGDATQFYWPLWDLSSSVSLGVEESGLPPFLSLFQSPKLQDLGRKLPRTSEQFCATQQLWIIYLQTQTWCGLKPYKSFSCRFYWKSNSH